MNVLNDVDTFMASRHGCDDKSAVEKELQLLLDRLGGPAQVDVHLRKIAMRLKTDFLSEDGKSVDYQSLKTSDVYRDFKKDTLILNYVNLDELSQERLKAFFINVYNVLTIHGIASAEPLPKTVVDISSFWRTTAYSIGGAVYSLDDIEHGILRSNRRHPAALSPQFGADDCRKRYAMDVLDPRIHFALNCGAKSCPAVRFYTEENLDESLNKATRAFLKSEVQITGSQVKLSKLFQWYGADFGETSKDILRWIQPYLPDNVQQELDTLIVNDKFDIAYEDYDWSLNLG